MVAYSRRRKKFLQTGQFLRKCHRVGFLPPFSVKPGFAPKACTTCFTALYLSSSLFVTILTRALHTRYTSFTCALALTGDKSTEGNKTLVAKNLKALYVLNIHSKNLCRSHCVGQVSQCVSHISQHASV